MTTAPSIYEYAVLAAAIYSKPDKAGTQQFSDEDAKYREMAKNLGWVSVAEKETGVFDSGLEAAVFKKGATKVIAFKGTSPTNPRDLDADMSIALGMSDRYYSAGESFADKHCQGASDLVFTGHSLGGAVAQVVGNRRDRAFVSFNAPGVALFASRNFVPGLPDSVSDALRGARVATTTLVAGLARLPTGIAGALWSPQQAMRDMRAATRTSKGVNYRLTYDPVSRCGVHYGKIVTLPGSGHGMANVLEAVNTNQFKSINFPIQSAPAHVGSP